MGVYTYIPVVFAALVDSSAVKVVGCYLKLVPNYKLTQHNKKPLEQHLIKFKVEFFLELMILHV